MRLGGRGSASPASSYGAREMEEVEGEEVMEVNGGVEGAGNGVEAWREGRVQQHQELQRRRDKKSTSKRGGAELGEDDPLSSSHGHGMGDAAVVGGGGGGAQVKAVRSAMRNERCVKLVAVLLDPLCV